MASTTTNPSIHWAQRSILASDTNIYWNKLILSIAIPQVEAGKYDLNVTETSISFKASSPSVNYQFEFEFNAPVVADQVKSVHSGSIVEVLIPKKGEKEEYWPRLNKGNKLHYIATDFERWVDEDEQDEEVEPAAGGFGGMGGMPGMGGMGGMGGMPNMMDFNSLGGGGMPGMGGLDNFDMSQFGGLGGDDGDEENLGDGDDDEESGEVPTKAAETAAVSESAPEPKIAEVSENVAST